MDLCPDGLSTGWTRVRMGRDAIHRVSPPDGKTFERSEKEIHLHIPYIYPESINTGNKIGVPFLPAARGRLAIRLADAMYRVPTHAAKFSNEGRPGTSMGFQPDGSMTGWALYRMDFLPDGLMSGWTRVRMGRDAIHRVSPPDGKTFERSEKEIHLHIPYICPESINTGTKIGVPFLPAARGRLAIRLADAMYRVPTHAAKFSNEGRPGTSMGFQPDGSMTGWALYRMDFLPDGLMSGWTRVRMGRDAIHRVSPPDGKTF